MQLVGRLRAFRNEDNRCNLVLFQNLFAQQSAEQAQRIFATSQVAMDSQETFTEKQHTLEEYSYDHFRYWCRNIHI